MSMILHSIFPKNSLRFLSVEIVLSFSLKFGQSSASCSYKNGSYKKSVLEALNLLYVSKLGYKLYSSKYHNFTFDVESILILDN